MIDYFKAFLYALAGWLVIESIWKAWISHWHTRKMKGIDVAEYCDKCYHDKSKHRHGKFCQFPLCICGLPNEEVYAMRLMMRKKVMIYDSTNTIEERKTEEVREPSRETESIHLAERYRRSGKEKKLEKRKSKR